jgi:hypothetical protein
MQKRRYEMLLPLKYNDGRAVEEEKIYQTREELIAQFAAVSFQPGVVQGIWVNEGARYEDDLRRVVVDVEDTPEARLFFLNYKPVMCERFQQIEIYIVSYPVEIL